MQCLPGKAARSQNDLTHAETWMAAGKYEADWQAIKWPWSLKHPPCGGAAGWANETPSSLNGHVR